MTEALRFDFVVACPPEHAFDVWTSRIDTWWPRDHTVGDAVSVQLVEGIGGRIFELDADGTEHDWGRVTAWDRPAAWPIPGTSVARRKRRPTSRSASSRPVRA